MKRKLFDFLSDSKQILSNESECHCNLWTELGKKFYLQCAFGIGIKLFCK